MVCEPSKTTLHVSFQPNQTTPTSETKVSIHQIKPQPLPICPRAIGQANRSHVDINGIIPQIPTCFTQAKPLPHIKRSFFLKGTSKDLFFFFERYIRRSKIAMYRIVVDVVKQL